MHPSRGLTGGETYRGGAIGAKGFAPLWLPPSMGTNEDRAEGLVLDSSLCSGNAFSLSGGSRACNSQGAQPGELPLHHLILGHIESRLSGLRTFPLRRKGSLAFIKFLISFYWVNGVLCTRKGELLPLSSPKEN